MKNLFISLDSTSQVRKDALNTIKYTLLLNYNTPILNESDFIPRLMESCQQCCKGLFTDHSDVPAYYNYFGVPQLQPESPLSYLNMNPIPAELRPDPEHSREDDKNYKEKAGFHTMILQHCILSSYHTIVTALLNKETVTSYEVVNKIKNKGIHALYKDGILLPNDNGLKFHQPVRRSNSKKSSTASDFMRKTQSHDNTTPSIMDLLTITNSDKEDSSKKYLLQFSSFCYKICNIPAPDFRNLQSTNKKSTPPEAILSSIKKLTDKITPKLSPFRPETSHDISSAKGDLVDMLYDYYLSERSFNLNLFYALLTNIKRSEENTTYRLCQKDTLSILTMCQKLPNVFSRQYFLKYAFDSIVDIRDSYSDFWHSQQMESSFKLFSSSREDPIGFQFPKWLQQYKLFINHMAEFVIPVYEWCFLNMLLDSIEKTFPNKTHAFHLIQAMDLLANHMSTPKYFQKILNPIRLQSDMDCVDVITKHKNVKELEALPIESILQIMTDFFSHNTDTQLNLTLLNPDFFKQSTQTISPTNECLIRKFYSTLIRFTYLQ